MNKPAKIVMAIVVAIIVILLIINISNRKSVEIVDYVTESESPWFSGPLGIVVRDPIMLPRLIPFKGMLGFFDVPDEVIHAAS